MAMIKIVKPYFQVAYPPGVSIATGAANQANEGPNATSEARACGVLISDGTAASTAYISRPIPMPQPRMAMRASRKVFRWMLVNHMAGLPDG